MKRTTRMALWGLAAGMVAVGFMRSASAGPASYDPVQGGGYAHIAQLAGAVEKRSGLAGFKAFALGVATNESKGNNLAVNDSKGEAAAACNLYKANANTRYKNNPYPPEDFCFGTGGWYGLMPATALAGSFFRNSDPMLIFDPKASTVMLADFVRRVANGYWHKLPPEHRTLLTVRRFMVSNSVGLDWQETKDRSRFVRQNFASDLQARGYNPNVMYTRVSIAKYPGTAELYAWIQNLSEAV